MTRGRKPKPTHLRLVEGNPGKRALRPDTIKPNVPAEPLEPPEHLSDHAKEEWRRINVGLHRMQLLSHVDRAAFTAYCDAWGRYRQASEILDALKERDPKTQGLVVRTTGGNYIQNPVVGMLNKARSDMVKFATEFGFTPAARARISADDAAGKGSGSKFEGLIGGGKTR